MDQTGCSRTKDACSSKGASSKNREVAQADTRRNAKKGIRPWRIIGFARVGLFITAARQPRSDAALLVRCIDPKKALNRAAASLKAGRRVADRISPSIATG